MEKGEQISIHRFSRSEQFLRWRLKHNLHENNSWMSIFRKDKNLIKFPTDTSDKLNFSLFKYSKANDNNE